MNEITEQELLSKGFEFIGKKSNGVKIYMKDVTGGEESIVVYLFNEKGESLGNQFFEKEMIELLWCNIK